MSERIFLSEEEVAINAMPYAAVGSPAVNELDTTYWNQGSIFGARLASLSQGRLPCRRKPRLRAPGAMEMCIRAGLHSGISAVGLTFFT